MFRKRRGFWKHLPCFQIANTICTCGKPFSCTADTLESAGKSLDHCQFSSTRPCQHAMDADGRKPWHITSAPSQCQVSVRVLIIVHVRLHVVSKLFANHLAFGRACVTD